MKFFSPDTKSSRRISRQLSDLDLIPEGRQQAKLLAEHLKLPDASENSMYSDCLEIFSPDKTKKRREYFVYCREFSGNIAKKGKQDEHRKVFRGALLFNERRKS